MGSQEALQAQVCRVLETEISLHPYQWFVFRDFWSEEEEHI
jgi:predicted LPLAT superfamily acyltransferase